MARAQRHVATSAPDEQREAVRGSGRMKREWYRMRFLLIVLCCGCSALQGKEVVIIDTAACTLKCLAEQERAKGHEEIARQLEAIVRERAADAGAPP
jgi:hypothetical protein